MGSLLHNLVVRQDLGEVVHAVGVGDFPDHPAGYPCGETVCGDVPGHHSPRADDAVVPDGDPGAHRDRGPKPAVLANVHGLGVAQQLFLPLRLATYGWPSTLRSPMGYT